MQFLFQPLTYGFLLVAVPILVHLINMLRHRKQSWAAMDFLLESYRKHRRWVLLKQWLLLAARILAMLLLVAMLARWISSSQWLGIFGGRTTHHYVLLDDSYSMAEIDQTDSAYSRGLRAFSALVRSVAEQPGQHQLTLVRFSRAELAARLGEDQARIDAAADFVSQTVPRDPSRMLDRVIATQPSSMQLAPETTLDLVGPLIEQGKGEQAEVYIVSDFRRNEWASPETLRNKLEQISRAPANIHLIECAEGNRANLSLALVEPEQEVLASNVPLMVRFQVRNQSLAAARNVVVKVRSILYDDRTTQPASEQPYSGQVIELPPVVIEQIGPGETVNRQVQVVFGLPGQHVVEVALPDDALLPDNRRWCVIRIEQSQRVLQIDGDVNQSNAFFFSTALDPGGRSATGMTIETRDAAYLRDVSQEDLSQWDVVAMLDVPRLDPQAVAKLEAYCQSGGGVAFVAGPSTNIGLLNQQLYRNGEGIFPVPVEGAVELPLVQGGSEPQVVAGDHFIFAPLKNLSSSPFLQVQIRQILQVPVAFSLSDAGVEVAATGVNKRPLVVDKAMGNGHAVAILTGVQGQWSTWAQDPTFVVLALRTMGYLGSFRRAPSSEAVAKKIEITIAKRSILPDVELYLPTKSEGPRVRLQQKAVQSADGLMSRVTTEIDLSRQDSETVDALLRPGVFETWMVTSQGEIIVTNVAHNVPVAEGDLARMSAAELENSLRPVEVKIRSAQSISGAGWSNQAASHSTFLMVLLGCLLLGEQALAYSASFHPPRLAKRTAR